MVESQNLPIVSVIIPCYNHGEFITEAIESVKSQTFKDFEIIVVDDGSTDLETLDTLAHIEKKYPEIRLIHTDNKKMSAARNMGVRAAKGEFFLPLDADDTIEPVMLEKCFEVLKKNPQLGFAYTSVRFFGDFEDVWHPHEYNFYELLRANQFTVSALIRKKAWEEVRGYDEKMREGYEDWEFWIRLGKSGWFGELIREPLFNYRKHGNSVVENSKMEHDAIIYYIRKKHEDLYARESLKKIKAIWNPKGSEGVFQNLGAKLEGAGLSDAEFWKKHPLSALGRCIPIRMKRKINSLFKKRIFDTSYYRRSARENKKLEPNL